MNQGTHHRPRWPGLSAATLTALLAATPTAFAAEWFVSPFARVAGDYDDNAGLSSRTDEEESISGFIGEIGAGIGYRSELYDFVVRPSLLSRRYPGDSDIDTDEQYADIDLTRQTRSGMWGIGGTFKRDYIRTGERGNADLEVEDPGDIEDDDSGRVGARDRRIRWGLTPRWRTRLSDTSSASARVRYVNTDYDKTEEDRLVDFQYVNVDARYLRNLTQRTTGVVELSGLWYDADETDSNSTSYGLQVGVRRDLSETTSFEALGGLSTSEREEGGSDTNWIGEVNLTRRLETIRIFSQYRRAISGTGSGTITRRDQVNVAFTRQLTDLLNGGLGLLAYNTNSVEKDVDFDERTYVQLRSQFTWKLTRTLDLTATYRYTLIDREDEDESANSNAVTVWLSYSPNPFTFSR